MKTIDKILSYRNQNVIDRYHKDYPDNTMAGDEAWTELLKFLWLTAYHYFELLKNPDSDALRFTCVLYEEMLQIDDMWHTFLLFTKDYQDFCQNYLGKFVHHETKIEEIKDKVKFQNELEKYLSYVYDKLRGRYNLQMVWIKERRITSQILSI